MINYDRGIIRRGQSNKANRSLEDIQTSDPENSPIPYERWKQRMTLGSATSLSYHKMSCHLC